MSDIDLIPKEEAKIVGAPDLTTTSNDDLYDLFCHGNLTSEEIDTIKFCFFFVYYAEESTTKNVIRLMKNSMLPEHTQNGHQSMEWVNALVRELHFMGKIKAYRKGYPGENKRKINFLEKINDLRNKLSHGVVTDLRWGEYPVVEIETKQKMMNDLYDSFKQELV